MANAKVIISAQSELDKGLNKAKSQLQDFEKAAGTIGNSISSMISKHAGIALLVGSITALGAAAKKCADEYIGVARENDRFEATMKNLTKTTGVTASEVQSLADKYEILTFHTAEQIQAASQLLLATGEISKEAFPRALEATMDLAEAMGQDLSSAASQMQKALAEPEEGLNSLRTAGINFSDSEEELIKSLIDSNQKLEAQELILKKVEERYAGVAKAVADTPTGKLDAIKETWGALQENIGESIVESLDGVFTWILTQLEAIRDFFDERNDKKEMQRITAEGVSDISEYGNARTYLTENQDLLNAITDLRKTIQPIANANDFYLSVEDEDLIDAISKQFGVNIKFDSLTGTIEETLVESVAKAVSQYEKENLETLFLTRTHDELEAMLAELEASDAQRDMLLGTLKAHPRDFNADDIERLEAEEKLYEFLKEKLPTFNPSGSGSSNSGLWLGDAGNVSSSTITNPIPTNDFDLSSILEPQKKAIEDAESYLESIYLSSLDAYDREIHSIKQLILQLETIDILSPLKGDADDLIEYLQNEIHKVEGERAEEQRKIAEEQLKAIEEQKREQTNLYTQAAVGQAEYIKNLQEAAKIAAEERREEERQKKEAQRNQWESEGFSGLETLFEMMGKEMSLDDVFGAFTAEFGRTRELGFDSLLGPLDTLLGALDPILDIVLSSNPVLAALLPIIESFVNVIASAIDTTIAPLMDFLTEIGTALGEVFLPIFDALRPSLDMIAEILRMFITPVLQILEPIIGAVVLAFDLLSPAIAAVGLVLTPLAAALEFVMDMFGFLGESLVLLGENIGIAFYNLTHWFNPKEFKTLGSFKSDAFDNFGEKMDKWFTMMEDDQVVSDSVSQQIATTNATYTGATTVHMNIYQNAPVVGENGMEQFAIMIRDKFEELNYFAA